MKKSLAEKLESIMREVEEMESNVADSNEEKETAVDRANTLEELINEAEEIASDLQAEIRYLQSLLTKNGIEFEIVNPDIDSRIESISAVNRP